MATKVVQKGWLKTREGDYFSPNTLAESLYTRDGSEYDDVVKGYVQEAKTELETTQMEAKNRMDALEDEIETVNSTLDSKINSTASTLNQKINQEITDRNTAISAAVQLHKDELNTHKVENSNQHSVLQQNINNNTGYITDTKNELLDKIKFYENEGPEGSDALYIVDGNGYKLAQFDEDGLYTTYIKATDFTAGNGFKFSGAMFYDLQGSITFPDGI